MNRRPGQQPEVNMDQLLRGVGGFFGRINKLLGGGGIKLGAPIVIGLIAIIWLGSGIYTVSPSEQAALRLFGKFTDITGPGLHWFWPSPIGARNIEAVTEIKRMELGFITRADGIVSEVPIESLMISGDENIVDVQMVVQYRIENLEFFLFKVSDPGEPARGITSGRPEGRTLKDAAEAALRQVVGQRQIDDVLTVEKEAIQIETRSLLQKLLDTYEMGIEVTEVKLQNVLPPVQVRDAFDDVVRAKEDMERTINLADAYKEDILPRARGEAAGITNAAEAFKESEIANAEGEAARFLSVLKEYTKAPYVTRDRLYLEAMEEILPPITKFVLTADSSGNLIQLLNLQQNQEQAPIIDTAKE
jgi:membrane protease subunit HflK